MHANIGKFYFFGCSCFLGCMQRRKDGRECRILGQAKRTAIRELALGIHIAMESSFRQRNLVGACRCDVRGSRSRGSL